MTDPLAEVVSLLQPTARFSKVVTGAGEWRVSRDSVLQPAYCVVLEGACRITADGRAPLDLVAGDFLLVTAPRRTVTSSPGLDPDAPIETVPVQTGAAAFQVGDPKAARNVVMLIGNAAFDSPDAAMLVPLLPPVVHIKGEDRLATLVELVIGESRAQRPARDEILSRLLEVLFIEALRSSPGMSAAPGLVRGLSDDRIAVALRLIHQSPDRNWTVTELAAAAALSRSAFFARFDRTVGLAPIEYLSSWRMALGRDMLRREGGGVAEVARRLGYSSASAFSIAFSRHVGTPPGRYARGQAET